MLCCSPLKAANDDFSHIYNSVQPVLFLYIALYMGGLLVGLAAKIALDVRCVDRVRARLVGLVILAFLLWGAISVTHTPFSEVLLPLVWAGTGLLAGCRQPRNSHALLDFCPWLPSNPIFNWTTKLCPELEPDSPYAAVPAAVVRGPRTARQRRRPSAAAGRPDPRRRGPVCPRRRSGHRRRPSAARARSRARTRCPSRWVGRWPARKRRWCFASWSTAGSRNQVTTTVIRGAPVLQEVFAIRNEHGEIVGALRSEMLVIEHERQRKRDARFRRAIARARDLIVAGQLRGGERLGRLGVHDGVMVIDSAGGIEYLSAPAEYLYRRLGYADNLVKTQLQELETNEYICFKAMERGVCLEQRVQEHDLVWIKRVVPLASGGGASWSTRLVGRGRGVPTGAIVAIEDVTDELQKEQELKIKTAMIQEIHHRVKNNLQTIAALLRLQARRTGTPEVADQLRESIGRILSIAVVHEFLSRDETSAINIHEVSNRILAEVRNGILDHARPISLGAGGHAQLHPACPAGDVVRADHQRAGPERGRARLRGLARGEYRGATGRTGR